METTLVLPRFQWATSSRVTQNPGIWYSSNGQTNDQDSVIASVIIFRGMGFRANLIKNSFQDSEYTAAGAYLHVKVGHSFNSFIPIPSGINVAVTKRDRKLILYGAKLLIGLVKQRIYRMRRPNVYTGRGVRGKGFYYIRKLGKKDARGSGKAW